VQWWGTCIQPGTPQTKFAPFASCLCSLRACFTNATLPVSVLYQVFVQFAAGHFSCPKRIRIFCSLLLPLRPRILEFTRAILESRDFIISSNNSLLSRLPLLPLYSFEISVPATNRYCANRNLTHSSLFNSLSSCSSNAKIHRTCLVLLAYLGLQVE
jgi:hypothetical protein